MSTKGRHCALEEMQETGKESMGWSISTLNEAVCMMRLCRSQFGRSGLELKSMTTGDSLSLRNNH